MTDSASSTVTPLEGKTTIDDKMSFGPVRLSYESAGLVAKRIATVVSTSVKSRIVVIAGTSLLIDFSNLQAVYLTLEGLQRDYDSLAAYAERGVQRQTRTGLEEDSFSIAGSVLPGAAAVALAPVSAFLSAALGLVSIFREDVEYHGAQTAIDSLAFELALAAQLTRGDNKAAKVFVPDLMGVPLSESSKGSLRDRLEGVQNSKTKAWASIGPAIKQLVQLEAELDQATKEKNQKVVDRLSSEVGYTRRDIDPLVSPLGRADQRFDNLQAQWAQVDQTTGLSPLARLLRAEAIHALQPLYLHAAIVSSGGHHRISHNLFRTMFLGDGLSFAGGAIARWALLEKEGSVADGGIVTVQRTSGTFWGLGDSTIESS